MRTKAEILKEINTLKEELHNARGTVTEVYTRIVGYYRAVQNWNVGKKSEYADRIEFEVSPSEAEVPAAAEKASESESLPVQGEALDIVVNDKGLIKKYKLFYADNCPGCPPVKNFLKKVHLAGEEINAGTREGYEEAIRNEITSTPTVLFFNDAGDVVNKAHTPAQIERLMA